MFLSMIVKGVSIEGKKLLLKVTLKLIHVTATVFCSTIVRI